MGERIYHYDARGTCLEVEIQYLDDTLSAVEGLQDIKDTLLRSLEVCIQDLSIPRYTYEVHRETKHVLHKLFEAPQNDRRGRCQLQN